MSTSLPTTSWISRITSVLQVTVIYAIISLQTGTVSGAGLPKRCASLILTKCRVPIAAWLTDNTKNDTIVCDAMWTSLGCMACFDLSCPMAMGTYTDSYGQCNTPTADQMRLIKGNPTTMRKVCPQYKPELITVKVTQKPTTQKYDVVTLEGNSKNSDVTKKSHPSDYKIGSKSTDNIETYKTATAASKSTQRKITIILDNSAHTSRHSTILLVLLLVFFTALFKIT